MDTGTILAIIISAVAVISTIIGPMITAGITCRHEKTMYAKRFYIEHEHEVIELYLHVVGRFAFGKDYDDQKDLGDAISEIFMYAPKELWPDIQNINAKMMDLLHHHEYKEGLTLTDDLRTAYFDLCEKFASLRRSAEEDNQRFKRKKYNRMS